MITRNALLTILAATVVGVGAYAASVATRPAATQPAATDNATTTLMNWLVVPAEQRTEITAHDPQFAQDLRTLRTNLAAKRLELAATLDDPKSTDEAIRAKLEALIAADAGLERRVADYLLAVRHHLTADQQRQLFGLCAQGVRQGPNCPWRMGADGIGPGVGPGPGPGAGRGPGGGRGMGRGPGSGGGGPGGGFGRGQGRGGNRP